MVQSVCARPTRRRAPRARETALARTPFDTSVRARPMTAPTSAREGTPEPEFGAEAFKRSRRKPERFGLESDADFVASDSDSDSDADYGATPPPAKKRGKSKSGASKPGASKRRKKNNPVVVDLENEAVYPEGGKSPGDGPRARSRARAHSARGGRRACHRSPRVPSEHFRRRERGARCARRYGQRPRDEVRALQRTSSYYSSGFMV